MSADETAPLLLLVDDDPLNRQIALTLVKKLGYRAELATNGQEAVDRLTKTGYAAVLMDIQMPVMDGLTATGIIRDPASAVLDHHIPVIALSANAIMGERERCLSAGINEFLSKPITKERLSEALQRYITKQAA